MALNSGQKSHLVGGIRGSTYVLIAGPNANATGIISRGAGFCCSIHFEVRWRVHFRAVVAPVEPCHVLAAHRASASDRKNPPRRLHTEEIEDFGSVVCWQVFDVAYFDAQTNFVADVRATYVPNKMKYILYT